MRSTTRAILRSFWFGLVSVCLAGCGPNKVGTEGDKASTEFEPNKHLFAAIGRADRLTLYEGLPHQAAEPLLLAEEKRNKPTVTLHGFPFYRPALHVPTDDVEKLKGVLGSAASFWTWQGERNCDGFHPDYLAEWGVGDDVYRVLICLGCSEVKVFGPDDSLRCDIRGDALGVLKDLLKKYRTNRPANG